MNSGMRVAYQGERGAFSESAARRLLGSDVTGVAHSSFEEMFQSVESGQTDCCIAPIENSLTGSIHRNYDLLLESALSIAGETNLRIVHNLIAPPDVPLERIRRVYSHPVALAQCGRFLRAHPALEPLPAHDTAGAVRLIMERGSNDEAAVASDTAATLYGARVVVGGIEDHSQNFTRFFLLAPSQVSETIATHEKPRRWKTSLVFRMPNKPSALFRALGAFSMFEIDLSKIESRPVEGRPWEYSFYLDIVGRRDEPHVARALDNLAGRAEMVRVFGSYPTRW